MLLGLCAYFTNNENRLSATKKTTERFRLIQSLAATFSSSKFRFERLLAEVSRRR